MSGVLVLVTGNGRSGTSTMSGLLHHLGLSVPGPYVGANDSNPKGFFESRWSVRFHNSLISDAGVNIFDSRPEAFDRIQAKVTPGVRDRLRGFLTQHVTDGNNDQIVVKDPRAMWVPNLWRDTAAEVGLSTRFVVMLRHPAETVGSRTTHYVDDDEEKVHRFTIANLARWTNAALITERETRGSERLFVRYPDLLADWRSVAAELRDRLGLVLNTDLAIGEHHPADDFVDPGLRRHQPSWEGLDVPVPLRDVAQETWDQLDGLAGTGDDARAAPAFDTLAESYRKVLADANALSWDRILGAREQGRSETPPAGPLLSEVGGRDLARELRGRIARRLRRESAPTP